MTAKEILKKAYVEWTYLYLSKICNLNYIQSNNIETFRISLLSNKEKASTGKVQFSHLFCVTVNPSTKY